MWKWFWVEALQVVGKFSSTLGKKKQKKPWIEKEWERGSGKCKDTGKNSKREYTPEAWKRKWVVEKENQRYTR